MTPDWTDDLAAVLLLVWLVAGAAVCTVAARTEWSHR